MARRLLQSVPVILGAPVKYLLRDDFNDVRLAGSVNGTPATPGPGTRTVVDTGNRLSVGSGVVSIATGGASGDPGLWYGSLSRSAGQILLCDANWQTNTIFGIDSNQSGGATAQLRYTGTIFAFNSASYGCQLETVSAGQRKMAVVIRTTGIYIFAIVGGVWKLVWRDDLNNTNPYFPDYGQFGTYAATSSTSIRIPVKKWLPTPLAYDTFTRANGALGNSGTTGPDGQATPARAWTSQVGTVEVSSNAAKATALSGDRAIATVSTGDSDVWVSSSLVRGTTSAGIVLRYEDSDNYLYVIHNGTNLQFIERVAGVETPLIDTAVTYSGGATMRCRADTTTGHVYYNNAHITTEKTIPSSTFGVHGLIFFDTGSTMDNFMVLARSTGYSILNKF